MQAQVIPQKALNISLQAVVSTNFDLPLFFKCLLILLVAARIVLLPFSICPDVEDHSQGPVVSLAVVDGIYLLLVHLLIPLFSLQFLTC